MFISSVGMEPTRTSVIVLHILESSGCWVDALLAFLNKLEPSTSWLEDADVPYAPVQEGSKPTEKRVLIKARVSEKVFHTQPQNYIEEKYFVFFHGHVNGVDSLC